MGLNLLLQYSITPTIAVVARRPLEDRATITEVACALGIAGIRDVLSAQR